MVGYLKLLGYVFLIYICTYSIVNRICKCVENHTEWKYRARIDTEWVNAQQMRKSGRSSEQKTGNKESPWHVN